jgi:hypothetical protein
MANNASPKHVSPQFPTLTIANLISVPELTQARLDRWRTLPIERPAQAEIASLTALMDAPLSVVEDGLFHRIVYSFVEIGEEDAQFHFGPGGCTLSRY